MLQAPDSAVELAKQLGIAGAVALLVLDRFIPFLPAKKQTNGYEKRIAQLEERIDDLDAKLDKLTSQVDRLVGWLDGKFPSNFGGGFRK